LFDSGGKFLKRDIEDGQTRCFIKTGCIPQTKGLADFVEYNEGTGTKRNAGLELPILSFDMETIYVDDKKIQPRRDLIQKIDDHFAVSSESEKDEEDFIDDE
jgi:hypothetical protein